MRDSSKSKGRGTYDSFKIRQCISNFRGWITARRHKGRKENIGKRDNRKRYVVAFFLGGGWSVSFSSGSRPRFDMTSVETKRPLKENRSVQKFATDPATGFEWLFEVLSLSSDTFCSPCTVDFKHSFLIIFTVTIARPKKSPNDFGITSISPHPWSAFSRVAWSRWMSLSSFCDMHNFGQIRNIIENLTGNAGSQKRPFVFWLSNFLV